MDYKDDQFWLMQGDCLERMKEIPDGSVDTILCDPPYIGMVNEKWDKITDPDAEIFYRKVFQLSYHKLRFGGRVIMFGSNDTLKYYYNRAIFDHRELLVVSKDIKTVAAGRNTKKYRQHVNCAEYIFVATKRAKEYTKGILKTAKQVSGLSSKQLNNLLGVKDSGGGMWSMYAGDNIHNQVPTEEQWLKFKQLFTNLPEYCTFKEVFNNGMSKGNVLTGFDFRCKGRVHPTQKPVELMEYLIKTYTVENSTVHDFTMGSGTTGVACKNLNRKFIGIEKDEKYFQIAKDRILT